MCVEEQPLEPLIRTSDSSLLPILKSVLAAAEIPFVVQGDHAMGLLPLGPFGGGLIRRVLGATILVPRDRLDEARELLEGIDVASERSDENADER